MAELYLFRTALRDLLRPRKVAAALFLAALPGIIVAFTRWKMGSGFTPVAIYNTMTSRAVFGILLVLVALVAATGVVTQEVEQHTIVYLLTRPVPRWRILLAKFLPAFVATVLVTWLSVGLVALAALTGTGAHGAPFGHDLLMLVVGSLVYGSLFLLLATVSERPLIPGLLYAFGWETWVSAVPGHFQTLSLMAYLQTLAPHPEPEGESVKIESIIGAFSPETISPVAARVVLGAVIVVSLLLALVIFSNREYAIKDETA